MSARCPHCGGEVALVTVALANDLVDESPALFAFFDDPATPYRSVRLHHALEALHKAGLVTVGELAVLPDRFLLKRVKHFGKLTLRELRAIVPFREDPRRAALLIARLNAEDRRH